MNKVKARSGVFNYKWLRQREIGCKPSIGSQDCFMKSLYSNIMPCSTWDYNDSLQHSMPGGVFNLEFSPDGSLLVAACEKRSILMFDPLSRKLIHAVDNAHFDCVNCVRFLDSRVFATCSDDSTVALWDARNLRSRIRTLQGHSNWVKNIEFSQSDGLLVTSGFDGSIYTWDINSYTEVGFLYKRVFHTNGLMRTRLNPDGSKMIICTTGGYLILIHDLDLKTLREDLEGFKPNMYRLMQLSQTTIPVAASFTHLFSHKRKSNRIEFVTDFPDGDDAEVVSSLQVHPQGWCALSRNISNDENSEWTCIHDIQEPYQPEFMEELPPDAGGGAAQADNTEEEDQDVIQGMFVIDSNSRARVVNTDMETRQRPYRRLRTLSTLSSNSSSPFRGFPAAEPAAIPVRDSNIVVTSTDVWEALLAIREARSRRERNRVQDRRVGGSGILMPDQEPHTRFRIVRMSSGLALADVSHGRAQMGSDEVFVPQPHSTTSRPIGGQAEAPEELDNSRRALSEALSDNSVASIIIRYRRPQPSENEPEQAQAPRQEEAQPSTSSAPRTIVILGSNPPNPARLRPTRPTGSRIKVPKNHKIHQNIPRLSHYIEEPNVGRGFIKELCFSSDGRLICSPFGYGVRLLAFSPECSELSTCVPKDGAVKLYELGTNVCHADIVVSTKFSPRHCLLVSGCLTGRIVWHQPVV
uniref:Uncharacterized protein n=1 Tax=Homalodisca liturata TaxID=320908 RepID=A0A1B6J6L9_9HEMI